MTSPLTTTSPLVVGRDRIEDKQGTPLAFVEWRDGPSVFGFVRRMADMPPGKGFDVLDPAGALLCRATDVAVRPGKEPTRVWGPDGREIGTITVARAGRRNFTYVLRDAAGATFGEGRFATKVKYGDVPKKLTHAFEDGHGTRLATADRKPQGGPQRVGFDGRARDDLRLLLVCWAIMLPNSAIGGPDGPRPVAREPEDFASTEQVSPQGGLFPGPSLVFHRERIALPDGRALATVREPFVAPHRGVSRALSENPQAGHYKFEVADPQGQPLFHVEKSGGAVTYDVEVTLPDGGRLGSIKRSGGVARAVFTIKDGSGNAVATVANTDALSSDYAVTDPGGAQVAALSRVQAVDEPWQIGLDGRCDERLRMLVVAFVIVQDLMLGL